MEIDATQLYVVITGHDEITDGEILDGDFTDHTQNFIIPILADVIVGIINKTDCQLWCKICSISDRLSDEVAIRAAKIIQQSSTDGLWIPLYHIFRFACINGATRFATTFAEYTIDMKLLSSDNAAQMAATAITYDLEIAQRLVLLGMESVMIGRTAYAAYKKGRHEIANQILDKKIIECADAFVVEAIQHDDPEAIEQLIKKYYSLDQEKQLYINCFWKIHRMNCPAILSFLLRSLDRVYKSNPTTEKIILDTFEHMMLEGSIECMAILSDYFLRHYTPLTSKNIVRVIQPNIGSLCRGNQLNTLAAIFLMMNTWIYNPVCRNSMRAKKAREILVSAKIQQSYVDMLSGDEKTIMMMDSMRREITRWQLMIHNESTINSSLLSRNVHIVMLLAQMDDEYSKECRGQAIKYFRYENDDDIRKWLVDNMYPETPRSIGLTILDMIHLRYFGAISMIVDRECKEIESSVGSVVSRGIIDHYILSEFIRMSFKTFNQQLITSAIKYITCVDKIYKLSPEIKKIINVSMTNLKCDHPEPWVLEISTKIPKM